MHSNLNVNPSVKSTSQVEQKQENKYSYESSDASAKSKTLQGDSDQVDRSEERRQHSNDDVYAEYATDENGDITERMQLNPSTDFYNDYEDDDGDDDDIDDDDSAYDESEEKNLPEPVAAARGPLKADEEEEEDMGYDEDDERIAITVERPKELPTYQATQHHHNINEESISGSGRRRYDGSNSDGSRFVVGKQNGFQRSEQNLWTENGRGDEVDSREGSGNFANDDEDDEEDDGDVNDEDSRTNDNFFNSKRSKSSSRYFRKNNNDAIKIISTPLGKVGIVYQQNPTEQKSTVEKTEKKSTGFTDFDALSPDPESSRRLASSHPKITPVLTPDGKVALLYRGDSENTKYEPIRNLTHKFNNSNNSSTDSARAGVTNEGHVDNEAKDSDTDESEEGPENKDNLNSGDYEKSDEEDTTDNKHIVDEQRTDTSNNAATPFTTGTFIPRPPDSVLPMINRPLSEVLGIKKNQFKQFRVKDALAPNTETTPRQLTGADGTNTDSKLHFLTKVNLADFPTSTRGRNLDFDFSRDNTMLDERKRKEDEQSTKTNDNVESTSHSSTIANEEVLSKTEVVNLAIVPHFDEELKRLQRLHEHENRRHHRQRQRHKESEEDLSGIHCIMQAMMGIAAISTVFGMLGTFFKQRILDQIRLMHHW